MTSNTNQLNDSCERPATFAVSGSFCQAEKGKDNVTFFSSAKFLFLSNKKKNPKCKSHVNREIDMKSNLKLNNKQNATIGKLFKVGTSEGEIRHLNI